MLSSLVGALALGFGVPPIDSVTAMTDNVRQGLARSAVQPLAAEWAVAPDAVLDSLRLALGASARADDPRATFLIGADDRTFQVGLRAMVGPMPPADLTPREARAWLGAAGDDALIAIADARRVHRLLRTTGLPAAGGLSGARLERAFEAVRQTVLGAAIRGLRYETMSVDDGTQRLAVVPIVAQAGDPRGMAPAEMAQIWGRPLRCAPGDELLFPIDDDRLLALVLQAIGAGGPPLYAFDGSPTHGAQALTRSRALADGARPSSAPAHTAQAGVPVDRWRRLRPDSKALIAGVPGAKADAIWTALTARAAETGWHPVLLGPVDEAWTMTADGAQFTDSGLAAGWHYGGTPGSALGAAAGPLSSGPGLTLEEFLTAHGAPPSAPPTTEPPATPRHPVPWPAARWADAPGSLGRIPDGAFRRVYIALVPTDAPWKVPAWLATYAAGESTPSNTALVLLARRLHRQHGAVVYGAGPASVSFRLPAPPSAEGMAELYALCRRVCPDVFGEVTAKAFAAARAAGRDLYFWWD